MFSSTAIALYGYDQGMMSLINTNKDYLSVMGLEEESPQVELSYQYITWAAPLVRYCSRLSPTAEEGNRLSLDVLQWQAWEI